MPEPFEPAVPEPFEPPVPAPFLPPSPPLPVEPEPGPHWPAPFRIEMHIWPLGQSLRGAGPHPGVQMPFAPLQMSPDIRSPQAPSACGPLQPHRPVAGRHCGLRPTQRLAFVDEHSVQAPASGPEVSHAGRAGSGQLGAPSEVHGPQVCVVIEQTGSVPPQSEAVLQATQAPPPEVSQRGLVVGQCVVSLGEQAPHAPLGVQMGVEPPHSALLAQPRQLLVMPLHTGVVPEHWAFVAHGTQVPVAALQTGVAPLHIVVFVAEQDPHAPLGWHAGVAPPHSPSPVHPRQVPVDASHTGTLPVHRLVFVGEQAPQAPVGWQAGVVPPQSPSAVHPRQVWVVVLHTGVEPEHCAFVRQVPHVPLDTSHSGVVPVHLLAFVAEQTPQAPLGWQAGAAPPQSPSPVHPRQMRAVVLQTGVEPEHCAFVRQVPHVPLDTSHSGVVPVHLLAFVAEQIPQAPLGWHAGVAPPQSPSPVHPRQVWVAVLHTGVEPEHCAFVRQETHVPVGGLQTGVAPLHLVAFVAEQTPQAPLGWQAAVDPPHSASPVHPRQVWVVVLHTGVEPEHCAFVRQAPHVPLDTSHSGVVPVHLLAFVAEQTPQAPLGWQAGVAPTQSPSPVHPRQVWVVVLHDGVEPEHCAFVRQVTQVPLDASQSGAVPVHLLALLAEQTPQAPLGWQAGVVPRQSPSAVHPRQVWVVVLHTGVEPEHCGSVRQETHVPVGGLQTGVAPLHLVALVAEQAPQAPLGWQAGVDPPHSPSPVHPRQVCAVELHTGVEPEHWAFVRQETHVPVGGLQTGVEPLHFVAFVAEHTPQDPFG